MFLLTSCNRKTTKTLSNSNTYSSSMEEIDLQSHLNLNFKINKDSLNQNFNKILDSLFVNDMDIKAMGFNVDLINLQNAEIEIQAKQVLTKLPMQIILTKKTFISDIDVDASLQIVFITELDVDSSWELKTKTTLEQYNWLKKPKVSFGGLNVGIESLSNIIINQSKSNLEMQIDSIMAEQFKLKKHIERVIYFLHDPILVDSTLSKWIHFNPDSIHVSEIKNNKSFYVGNIAVVGKTAIVDLQSDKREDKTEIPLPNLKWIDQEVLNSDLKMSIDISFNKLNKYLNKNFANKRLSNDGREIVLNDILISKKNKELICSATSTGDFNGKVVIKGIPIFDHKNQALVTEEINIDFETNNVLHKAGLWLLKGKINKKLSSMLNFSLQDRIEDIQSSINVQVDKLNKDYSIDLKCNINNIVLDHFVLAENEIGIFFNVNLFLESKISNLDMLQIIPE